MAGLMGAVRGIGSAASGLLGGSIRLGAKAAKKIGSWTWVKNTFTQVNPNLGRFTGMSMRSRAAGKSLFSGRQLRSGSALRGRRFASGAAVGLGALSVVAMPAKALLNMKGSTVGYGKRGIDANNMNTDGLVQGMSRSRRRS